jgi:glycosyltransferase involved in cell wall biosynthesis
MKAVALLGRRDVPTDAVREYCARLQQALGAKGVRLGMVDVPWFEHGWSSALEQLRRDRVGWHRQWAVLQYTALSWSRRGISIGFLRALKLLRQVDVRCAVVFHDAQAFGGRRLIEQARSRGQHAVMRLAYRLADRSIVTIPTSQLGWLPRPPGKAVFIPVGSNIPEIPPDAGTSRRADRSTKIVAVFGITGGNSAMAEVADISFAARYVASRAGVVKLVVFGRNSDVAKGMLEEALRGSGVDLVVCGLLPAQEVGRVLRNADVLLFVRGQLSSRRTSAVAAIACGLPIVGYRGDETGFPLTAAGVVLVDEGDREGLAQAANRVLADEGLREQLRQRSLNVERDHFAWEVIAEQYLRIFRND